MDGQGVDIGAERHALAGALLAVDQGHHGGGQGLPDLVHAHFLQLTADEGGGADLVHTQLRMGVDIAADRDQLVEDGIDEGTNIRHGKDTPFK